MIKLHNTGEYLVVLKSNGAQTTNGNNAVDISEPLPFDGQIKAVWGYLNTAGTTNTQTTDLFKNGASIVSSGTMLSFATAVTTPTYGDANLSANPTLVSKGDILSIFNTAVHTTPARDLVVAVLIQRRKGTGPVGAMLTGTFGNDVV